MKWYRFYADYPSNSAKRKDAMSPRYKRKDGPTPAPAPNVIAVETDGPNVPYRIQQGRAVADCTLGVFDIPNSDVAGSQVDFDYLRERCRRISETEARRIHPRLFQYLEG